MTSRRRREWSSGRDDRGAVTVLVSMLMAAIVVMAAIVIDVGYLRNGANLDQSVADLAVLSGSKNLSLENYSAACSDVVNYININLDISAIDATDFCAGMDSTVCSGGDSNQAAPSVTAGKWAVSVHFPVPDSEIADPHFTGAGKGDGTPCQRMRVIVTSTEPGFFGRFSKDEYVATRSATVRARDGRTTARAGPVVARPARLRLARRVRQQHGHGRFREHQQRHHHPRLRRHQMPRLADDGLGDGRQYESAGLSVEREHAG